MRPVSVSTSGTAGSAKELVRDKSPDELEEINQGKLKAIGVSDDLSDVFLRNRVLSLQERILLVDALTAVRNTGNRRLFIKAAALAADETAAQ